MMNDKNFPEQPEQEQELAEQDFSEQESAEQTEETPKAPQQPEVSVQQESSAVKTAGGFAAAHPVLKELADWVVVIAAALAITFVIRSFVFTMVVVEGPSMQNTLMTGDRLAVVRLGYEPKVGDIIVFYPNGDKTRPYIKRVIAVEGQTVDIHNGDVYVDGALIEEDYLGSPTTENGNQTYPLTIPEGYLFAMGDNRQHSLDCRNTSVGLVDYDDIVGKAWLRLFPFDSRFGSLYH